MRRFLGLLLLLAMILTLSACGEAEDLLASDFAPSEPVSVEIIKTYVPAYSVANYGGYCSVKDTAETDNLQLVEEGYHNAGMIDRTGDYIFPYISTFFDYRYYDGVFSLSMTTPYTYTSTADDGSFTFAPLYYREDGSEIPMDRLFNGGVMTEGRLIALVWGVNEPHHMAILDENGQEIERLDESFSTTNNGMGNIHIWHNYCYSLLYAQSDGYSIIKKTNPETGEIQSYGYRNNTTRETEIELVNTEYVPYLELDDGLVGVYSKTTERYGYLNTDGEEVIPCDFSAIGRFYQGAAYAARNGLYGYIDEQGREIIPFEYENAYGYANGLFCVIKDGKCGLVNARNEIVVPFEYDDMTNCEGQVAYAVKDGIVHIISLTY